MQLSSALSSSVCVAIVMVNGAIVVQMILQLMMLLFRMGVGSSLCILFRLRFTLQRARYGISQSQAGPAPPFFSHQIISSDVDSLGL
jgi:hypothetical protein